MIVVNSFAGVGESGGGEKLQRNLPQRPSPTEDARVCSGEERERDRHTQLLQSEGVRLAE